jgi:hypothetical protein
VVSAPVQPLSQRPHLGIELAYDNPAVGRTRCECGEWSPELPSTAARQRWHRDHKNDVLTTQATR